MDHDLEDTSRGVKRKATEDLPAPATRRIKPLDPAVVNKIAAGEIIVAPVHALKELIENAVDAGSTSLEIIVKEGGLKFLQITDNGHGINKEDLDILCERFTTSKLKTFEDLAEIGTYGFRGEALASISHIAHLTVTTKTKDSECAWRALYHDGKLSPAKPGQSAEPKPVAGKQGTQITVEDLFYNVPNRRQAFRNPNDEYTKILDIVGRYAVHCEGVAFSCKKFGETNIGISTQASAKTSDRIRQIYGNAVANELISFNVSDKKFGFTAHGMVNNANYHVKKTTLLLFINHRSVESSAIKKAFEATFQPLLPKGGRPFIYLSLEIEPRRVDVNVHPTKREVNFLDEDEIIEVICAAVTENLAAVDTSRSFMTQTLLPNRPLASPAGGTTVTSFTTPSLVRQGSTNLSSSSKSRPYENNLVRTDSKARKITSMLPLQDRAQDSPTRGATTTTTSETTGNYEIVEKERILIKLTSVKNLRASVRDSVHNGLTEVFANHTFVGIVDERKRIAAIQSGVKLFLVDYGAICYEYFYQIGLTNFGNFGTIQFDTPLKLIDLISIAMEDEKVEEEQQQTSSGDISMSGTQAPGFWEAAVLKIANQIISRREMLMEYFSLEITAKGELVSIPLLLKGYTPSMGKLPSFLLRIGPNVNWTNEMDCFHTFLRELALFYVPEPLPTPDEVQEDISRPSLDMPLLSSATSILETQREEEDRAELENRRKELLKCLEEVVFPGFKRRLLAPKSLLGSVTEVANLKGLYRIFERSC